MSKAVIRDIMQSSKMCLHMDPKKHFHYSQCTENKEVYIFKAEVMAISSCGCGDLNE